MPAATPEVRAAAPDLTIVSDARYDVQPGAAPGPGQPEPAPDQPPQGHGHQALLLRPRLPGGPAEHLGLQVHLGRQGDARGPRLEADERLHAPAAGPRPARLFSGKSAHYKLRFDLVDPGGAPTRDVRVGDSLVSFPVWAFATDGTPGSTVKVVFPAGFAADVEAGSIPKPLIDATGRTIYQTGTLDKPLSFFAYLIADRPGAYAERTASHGGRLAGQADDPGVAGRSGLVEAGRRSRRARPAGAGQSDRPALAARRRPDRTGGREPLDRRLRRAVRPGRGPGRGRLLRRRLRRPPRGGPRLVQRRRCWPTAGRTRRSPRTTASRSRRSSDVKPTGGELTPEFEAARIPLNDWGRSGARRAPSRTTPTRRPSRWPRRSPTVPGRPGLRAVWADAAGGVGAYQPPAGRARRRARNRREGQRPARLARPARPARRARIAFVRRPVADLGGTSHRPAAARRPPGGPLALRLGRRRGRRLAPAPAGARRDARVAVRDRDLPPRRRDADPRPASRDQGRADRLPASRRPDPCRIAFEQPDGFAGATQEAAAELEAIHRYDVAAAMRPAAPDLLQALGLWGRDARTPISPGREPVRDRRPRRVERAAGGGRRGLGRRGGRRARPAGQHRGADAGLPAGDLRCSSPGCVRGRRRRRRALAPGWVSEEPYATLAATPDDRGADRD